MNNGLKIGKKQVTKGNGQPEAHWDIFDATGATVGCIEADYEQAMGSYGPFWKPITYRARFFSKVKGEDEAEFDVAFEVYNTWSAGRDSVHGKFATAREALAAAKEWVLTRELA